MAGATTSFVLVGPLDTGPFGGREWRPRHGVALIEKHRPCWAATPIAHGGHDGDTGPAVYLPFGWSAAQELAAVVAARCIKDKGYLTLLAEHGVPDLRVAEDRDDELLPVVLADAAVALVARVARLGVVQTERGSWLDDEDLHWLRGAGVDVDDFRLRPLGATQA